VRDRRTEVFDFFIVENTKKSEKALSTALVVRTHTEVRNEKSESNPGIGTDEEVVSSFQFPFHSDVLHIHDACMMCHVPPTGGR
jgi:hypothetical protein